MADRAHRPTLADVARRAGVSTSTASRVLSGARAVSPDLRRRVQSAVNELGYLPNAAARGLRVSRSMTLGLVFRQLSSPAELELLNGLTAVGQERDYMLLVTNGRADPVRYRSLVQRLSERRVDGIFLVAPPSLEDTLRAYVRAGFPVLALGHGDPLRAEIPVVAPREDSAIRAAIQRFVALGHRGLAHVCRPESMSTPRILAIRRAAADRGIGLAVRSAGEDFDAAHLLAILTSPPHPTAVLIELDLMPALMTAARAADLRVPADFSVVAFGDSRWVRDLSLPLAAITTDAGVFGAQAASVMLARLAGDRSDPILVGDATRWIERDSVGPAPPGPRAGRLLERRSRLFPDP